MRGRVLAVVSLLSLVACSGGDDDDSAETTIGSAPTTAGEIALGDDTTPDATDPPDATDTATGADGEDDDLPLLDDIMLPAWTPETRTDELAIDLEESDELTVQMAVDAAALLVPEFPGATPTPLPSGEGFDPTYTIWLLEQVRDELTPEQRAYLEEIDAEAPAATIGADGTVTISDDGEQPATSASAGFAPPSLRQPPRAVKERYARLLKDVVDRWERHHKPVVDDIDTFDLHLSNSAFVSGDGEMAASLVGPRTCRVLVGRVSWGVNPPDDRIIFFYAHELFHCYQHKVGGGFTNTGWVREGSAEWAAVDLFRDLFPPQYVSDHWFSRSNRPLAGSRGYEAWPIYELELHQGIDPYSVIREQLLLPSGTTEEYLARGQMERLLFRMDWTSSSARLRQVRERTWRFPWPSETATITFGSLDNVHAHAQIGIGRAPVINRGNWTHGVLVIPFSADVGLVTVTPGGDPITTIARSGTVTIPEATPTRLCFAPDGCRCPKGFSAHALQMRGRAMVFSMPASGSSVRNELRAERWDPRKHCREGEEPERARSYGDPHLQSFDGLVFDSMTLGEFVYARDPDGGFEVQARHRAGGLPGAASTSAVAVSDGEHRITFTYHQTTAAEPAVVRVDGDVQESADFTVGDLVVTGGRSDSDYAVSWPDGSTLRLAGVFGWWFFDLDVAPSRASRLVGLLGAADDDVRNDLVLRDGTVVDERATAGTEAPHTLSWQVDEQETLFDYLDGESIATFRIPHPNPEPISPTEETIEQCKDALGPDASQSEVEWCAYDIEASGEDDFVETYEQRVDTRVAEQRDPSTGVVIPIGETTTTTGPPAEEGQAGAATLVLEGLLVAPYATPSASDVVTVLTGSLEAAEGTVLAARTPSCDTDTILSLIVRNRETEAQATAFLCDPMGLNGVSASDDDEVITGEVYLWMSSGGTYDVRIESDSEEPLNVTAEVFVDPTPTIVRDAELAGGTSVDLAGVADTAVFVLGLDDNTYAATGLDQACGFLAYGAPPVGEDGPWSVSFCPHTTDPVGVGDQSFEIPLIVFTRTDEPATVTLTPTG